MNLTIFSDLIFILVLVVLIFIIKAYTQTIKVKKKSVEKCNEIINLLKKESFKYKQISQRLVLSDNLQTTLFKRFFKITEDLLWVQKMIFDNHLN